MSRKSLAEIGIEDVDEYLADMGIEYTALEDGITTEWRISPNHPYAALEGGEVTPMRGGWRVRWRDFFGQRQDPDFATRDEAEAFAATLPKLIFFDQSATAEDAVHCDFFWRSLKHYNAAKGAVH